MKKLPSIFILTLLALVFASPALAQSSTPSANTLPETGIATPFLLISGGGLSLLGTGLFFKKLQK